MHFFSKNLHRYLLKFDDLLKRTKVTTDRRLTRLSTEGSSKYE